jgi:Flp pilus assembly protein TadD
MAAAALPAAAQTEVLTPQGPAVPGGVSPLKEGEVFGKVVPLTEDNQQRLDELARIVRENPDDALEMARYGLALIQVGRKDDGLAALTRASAQAPEDPRVSLYHAKGLWKSGYVVEAFDEALEVTRSPLASQEDVAEAYFVAGTVRSIQGDYGSGEKYLVASIARDAGNIGALVNLGLMLVAQGRSGEGLGYLMKARVRAPESERVQLTYAKVLEHLGKMEEAREAWEVVLRFRPDDVYVLAHLGGAYLATHRNEQAAEKLARVVELEPDDPLAHLMYGEALLRLGRYDEARLQAAEAGKLGQPAESLLAAIEFEERQAESEAAAGR